MLIHILWNTVPQTQLHTFQMKFQLWVDHLILCCNLRTGRSGSGHGHAFSPGLRQVNQGRGRCSGGSGLRKVNQRRGRWNQADCCTLIGWYLSGFSNEGLCTLFNNWIKSTSYMSTTKEIPYYHWMYLPLHRTGLHILHCSSMYYCWCRHHSHMGDHKSLYIIMNAVLE